MYTFQNISVDFGSTKALSQISFTLTAGDPVGLIGASGSGKTTLLKLFNAQVTPTSGSLLVKEKNITQLSSAELKKLRSKIAYIPQDLGLVPSLSVLQNILLGRSGQYTSLAMLKKFFLPTKNEKQEVLGLLDRVGIADKLYSLTDKLSGGQKQRVAVAKALFQKAHTLLADEPVSAVDPARAHNLVALLKEVAQENELMLVMSIHNIELAKEFFPRLVGLKNGHMLFDSHTATEAQLTELYQLSESQLL